MQRKPVSHKTFKTPFCREYWQLAFAEFKDTRMIVFAALILALRVAVKPLSIPVAGDLKEGIGFIVNAFGSMIYGPVLALLSGALSDTLGYLLYPSGVYFPAYMITEMAGGSGNGLMTVIDEPVVSLENSWETPLPPFSISP